MIDAEKAPELMLQAGRDAEQAGDLETALRAYTDALAGMDVGGSLATRAEILRCMARVYHKRGDYNEALDAAQRSLDLADQSDEPEQVVAALYAVAISEQFLGRLDRAESMYLRAASIAQSLEHAPLIAIVQQNLATIASIRGDLAAALERSRAALKEFRRGQDVRAASHVLSNIAMTYADMHDFPAAQATLDEAHRHASAAGDLDLLAHIELNRANLLLRIGERDEARPHCDRAFELYTRLESKSGLAETYKCYGLMYRESDKPALAEAHLAMVVQLAQQCEDPLLEAEAEYERALVLLSQGRNADVLQALNRAQRLFTELRVTRQVVDIEQRLDRLQETYLQVVRAWAESIESKDLYTAGHCGRVADYTCLLAEAAGFTGRDLVWIRMGAFLHDVGKTAVPEQILNKPGPLTEEEWVVMKAHSSAGDDIVKDLHFPFDVRPIVRNHHERWDGTGYPDGLKGDDIPLTARILCIADIYDALTTSRSYRPAFSHDQALAIMDGLAGQGVDPELYRMFRVRVLGSAAQEASAVTA